MSNSPEFSDFAGRKSGKLPDRSNFSQTCNLLSQFLKEKGRFGDLSLGMAGKSETKGMFSFFFFFFFFFSFIFRATKRSLDFFLIIIIFYTFIFIFPLCVRVWGIV